MKKEVYVVRVGPSVRQVVEDPEQAQKAALEVLEDLWDATGLGSDPEYNPDLAECRTSIEAWNEFWSEEPDMYIDIVPIEFTPHVRPQFPEPPPYYQMTISLLVSATSEEDAKRQVEYQMEQDHTTYYSDTPEGMRILNGTCPIERWELISGPSKVRVPSK